MTSKIDSGVDTGNDSNDGSLQEKSTKMDLEVILPQLSSDSNSACKVTRPWPNYGEAEYSGNLPFRKISLTNNGPFSPRITIAQLEPQRSIAELEPSAPNHPQVDHRTKNAISNITSGVDFVPPIGRNYVAKNLVTKMQRMRRHTIIRSGTSCNVVIPLYKSMEDHFKMLNAVSHNKIDIVREMLKDGYNPNCSDRYWRSPLHIAAVYGYVDMIKLLLDFGANPNAKDRIGNTPLHLATCTNHVQVIILLIQAGTRLDEKDLAGHSPLQLAITKLNIMKRSLRPDAVLVEQITQVVQMMSEYMKQKEQVEPALLTSLFSVIKLNDSSHGIESNIQDLLSKLTLSS